MGHGKQWTRRMAAVAAMLTLGVSMVWLTSGTASATTKGSGTASVTIKGRICFHTRSTNHCWGFDQSKPITNIKEAGGRPDFVGRYLDRGAPTGPTPLTKAEVRLFHNNRVRVLLLADLSGGCTSASEGVKEAETAARAAGALHVNKQAVIFLDVEPGGTGPGATRQCLNAYASRMIHGDHRRPGFYENPLPSNVQPVSHTTFNKEFCAADAEVHSAPLWSQQPNPRGAATGPKGSPSFGPDRPTCKNNTVAWQYNNTKTNYDLDEITPSAIPDFWLP